MFHVWESVGDTAQHQAPTPHLVILLDEDLEVVDFMGGEFVGGTAQHQPPTPHLGMILEEGLEVVDFMGGNSL